MLLFDRQATDRYRFRHRPIRFAPILADLSPIPPGAAVSADVGFILIAISAERIVIIKIRWRIPHGQHFDSSKWKEFFVNGLEPLTSTRLKPVIAHGISQLSMSSVI
jgi:hypothetical protein